MDQPDTPEIRAALQRIGDAIASDDRHEYLSAVAHARIIGATDEQVDATYRHHHRLRVEIFRRGPHFDVTGTHRENP